MDRTNILTILGVVITFILVNFVNCDTKEAEDVPHYDIYNNFSSSIAQAIEDMMKNEEHSAHDVNFGHGFIASSPIGFTHTLAVLNEKMWPSVSFPVFESAFKSASPDLPSEYEKLFKLILPTGSDLTFSSALFTNDKTISQTPRLAQFKTEVVKQDLSAADAGTAINSYINKFLGIKMDQNYIPDDAKISQAALGILVDTIHLSGTWESPVTKVATPSKFNDKFDVEMLEMSGKFSVLEGPDNVQVIIPFKNPDHALVLVLPKNITNTGELGMPEEKKYEKVTVQFPAFKASLRGSDSIETSKCDFTKQENIFQQLDDLIYISIDTEKLEAVSITGSAINNVAKFKTDISSATKPPTIVPVSPKPNVFVPPPPTPPAADAKERLIVFNSPFTFSIVYKNLGPFFTGSVLNMEFMDKANAPKSTPGVFGLTSASFPFAKCI